MLELALELAPPKAAACKHGCCSRSIFGAASSGTPLAFVFHCVHRLAREGPCEEMRHQLCHAGDSRQDGLAGLAWLG